MNGTAPFFALTTNCTNYTNFKFRELKKLKKLKDDTTGMW